MTKTKTAHAAASLAAAVVFYAGAALGQVQTCGPAPVPPPEADRPINPGDPPPKPACIDAQGHTNRCRRGEIDRANAEVDAFNVRIQKFNEDSKIFLDHLNRFIEDANTYTRCELDIMNGRAPAARP
jgi:hypothetical protein